ncbi:hypothetical protein JTB14_003807 [Gonioctena quinquepunctata]|nr:hypothetical protein JTB14_003807 [Gonioctena quinquepunctata]
MRARNDQKTVKTCISNAIFNKPVAHSSFRRLLHKENMSSFCEDLEKEQWGSIMGMSDLNSALNTFHQVFLYYFEVNFPAKEVGVDKNKKSCVNREIRESSQALKDFSNLKQHHPEFSEQYKVAKRKHFASKHKRRLLPKPYSKSNIS